MASQATDRLTGEPVILEIKTAPGIYWSVVDPGPWTRLIGLSFWVPWRALSLGALGAVVGLAVRSGLLLGVSAVAGVVLGTSEMLHRRDFITSHRIVRQSGILGRRRVELLLTDVQDVRVSYFEDAQRFRAGDVEVSGRGSGLTFQGVADPQSVAEAIRTRRGAQGAGGA